MQGVKKFFTFTLKRKTQASLKRFMGTFLLQLSASTL